MHIRYRLRLFIGVIILIGCYFPAIGYAQFVLEERDASYYYDRVQWQDTVIAEGVTWRKARVGNFFEAPQSFNAIIIDRSKTNLIPHIESARSLATTTSMMQRQDAIIGINASFYQLDPPKPITFTVSKGKLQALSVLDLKPYLDNGGIRFKRMRDLSIVLPPSTGWYLTPIDSNVIASGPLLRYQGEDVALPEGVDYLNDRMARTAFGILTNGHLLLLVVDGGTPQAEGLSVKELQSLLGQMDAYSALNLDGGGSSTLALQLNDSTQVVNYPSDNGRFDHKGERKISTALIFAPPPPPYVEVDSLYIKY